LKKWLTTSEYEDVLVSLQETEHQMERIRESNIQGWKWATIALANASCGALVCNLSGSMQIGALTRCHAEKMIAALEANSSLQPPKSVKLASPRDLLKRARRIDQRLETAGPPLQLNSNQIQCFYRLMHLRNQFSHFEPMGWTIQVSMFLPIYWGVLEIVEQIVDDGWSLRHLATEKTTDVQNVIKNLRGLLREFNDLQNGGA
jgi:hypothetical protein